GRGRGSPRATRSSTPPRGRHPNMSLADPPGVRDILAVDLLGGIGDLVMLLPSIHALARRHPRAAVRVLTHAPGSVLLAADPAVVEVRTAEKGDERAAVVAELERRRFDLVVSTTRYDGIPAEIERRVLRSVTDLWRRPPPDELVSRRYLRLRAAADPPDRRGTGRRPAVPGGAGTARRGAGRRGAGRGHGRQALAPPRRV